MIEIKLNIPVQTESAKELQLDLRTQKIDDWLEELPLTNVSLSAEKFLAFLTLVNQAEVRPDSRFDFLQQIHSVAIDIIESLRETHIKALLPLNDEIAAGFMLALNINKELIIGFKSVIRDLVEKESNSESNTQTLIISFNQTIYHLSLIQLESYLTYAPLPPGIWGEINQLYLLAEKRAIHNILLAKETDEAISQSIASTYKRAILMGLTNPYHLMQGESPIAFKLLDKLTQGIMIFPPEDKRAASACFIVDLETDSAPHFVAKDNNISGFNPRTFDLSKLLAALDSHINKLQNKTANDGDHSTGWKLRQERDMFMRIRESLGREQERQFERKTEIGKVRMTIGLSSCHYHINNKADFTPEMDELHIHTGGKGINKKQFDSDTLTLTPIDHEPWKPDDAENRLASGIDKPRTSNFDADSTAMNIWKNIYAVKSRKLVQDEEKGANLDRTYIVSSWNIKNISSMGWALQCTPEFSMPVRVGEVITYKPEGSTSWTVGAIRWMNAHDDHLLEMGVMMLSTYAKSIAVRSIKGVGEGGEYMRSILINHQDINDSSANLIVPPAIYDTGTDLAINMGTVIQYVQLTRLLLGTKSFAQFQFQVIDIPKSESEKISEIRKMM